MSFSGDISGPLAPVVVEPQPPQRLSANPSLGAPLAPKTPVHAPVAVNVSAQAHALSTLQGLSHTDPARFKQAAAQYAAAFKAQAAQVGGAQGSALTRLARKLDTAARLGSLHGLHLSAPRAGSVQAAYALDTVPIPEALKPHPLGPPQLGVVPSAPAAPSDGVSSVPAAPSGSAPAAGDAPASNAQRFSPPQA